MATRVTRSTRRFRSGKSKRETIWTTITGQSIAAALPGANIPQSLVLPVDWVRGTNYERGAVLAGIRGWYQVGFGASSTSTSPNWFLAIAKQEVDEVTAGQDWTTSTPYNSEDVLYTDGGHINIATATPSSALHLSRQIEVRTKRKLTSDDFIGVNFMSPSSAQDWEIGFVLRALIVLP